MVAVIHEPIRYQNQDFAIHHLIDDCPSHTVIRELVKNAVEAATDPLYLATGNAPGLIRFFVEKQGGVRKLGLFNEGPGMTADQLAGYMNLASSGKRLGLSQNYGQGGKISALKASPLGVIYRSCHRGKVCQIVLSTDRQQGEDYPRYIKRRQQVSDESGESWEVVLDVTDAFRDREDRPLGKDWTEVVLVGKSAGQDTVAELLPDEKTNKWLIRLVNQRFYRFPLGIEVRSASLTTGGQDKRSAKGLEAATLAHSSGEDGRIEDVSAIHPDYGPLVIRYVKLNGQYKEDAAGDSRGRTLEAYGIGSRGDHVCLVWRDECYEFKPGWSRMSGAFGVTFGSANIVIQILLPDSAPVKNNTYRDQIIRNDDNSPTVRVEEFSDLARANRPQWLIDYVEAEARKSTHGAEGVMNRLRNFLQEIMALGEKRSKVEGEGNDQGETEAKPQSEGGRGPSNNPRHQPDSNGALNQPSKGKRAQDAFSGIPEVMFTSDPAKVQEMRGRAAEYDRSRNVVLLNREHWKYQADLERIYEEAGPDSDRRQIAKKLYDEEYMTNAGKFVIQSWVFKGKAEWTNADWEAALGMGALTVFLVSPQSYDEAYRKLRQRLGANKPGE